MNSKKYFDEVAHQWEIMRKGFFSEDIKEKAFSVAGVQAGKKAADIGAGTGFITEGLIRKGLQVIAVDQSDTMLAEMKRRFDGIDCIDYHQGEAEKLPVPDETVDCADENCCAQSSSGDELANVSIFVASGEK